MTKVDFDFVKCGWYVFPSFSCTIAGTEKRNITVALRRLF